METGETFDLSSEIKVEIIEDNVDSEVYNCDYETPCKKTKNGEAEGVVPETVNHPRQFIVLDEVNNDEGADNETGSENSDDLSDEEIYNMLEEGYANGKQQKENESEAYDEREKVVLVEKTPNHFEVLPDGWITVTHNSGIPVYLHRTSRVCTLAKPYFLGPGSARKHEIPLSAIPCLEYARALEEEKKNKENNVENPSTIIVNGCEIPKAKVETAQENQASKSLDPEQVREYCKRLFEFETIKIMRFKSWPARRSYSQQKRLSRLHRPTLPKDTKLISCPIQQPSADGKTKGPVREWIMNPNGKSYVCILQAYVQRVLKKQPVYEFKEIENAATPYSASVKIGDMHYGTGLGSSKKQAKLAAAKTTLEILIPEIKDKIDQDEKNIGRAGNSREQSDLSFFDGIKIDDPRVAEFCEKTTEPSPYAILLTCLQRNYGLNEMNIKYEVNSVKPSKNEITMIVGTHSAKVTCQNKRDGKQRASQAILQRLHPHITSWGSLLRLYGNNSVKSIKEKKLEEQEITLLQSCAAAHSPNYEILKKLKEEMMKYKAKKDAIKPIGTFIPPDDVDLPSASGSDLKNVNL